MAYSTETDIIRTIAQSLTSATADTADDFGSLVDLMNIGNSLDKNLISNDIIDYYIQLADSDIDSSLSQLYNTPFCESVDFETVLFSEVSTYNDMIVLERNCPLAAGDIVILKDSDQEERHEIEDVIDGRTFTTIGGIQYYFPEETRVLRVVYPPPIRFISARLASANIYDKYFSAEVSPNTSGFGDKLRELAYSRINDVLNGTTILHGSQRIGRRFYNSNLVEQYALPTGGTIAKDYKQVK